jgi:drug/metabolite transporter (DMT)-like permease
MLVAGACAILMGLSGRELSSEMDLFQIMFCRNLIALSFTIFALLCTGLEGVRTRFIKRHVFRNLVHFSATYLWFLGIISIPMAAVFALEFTTPLWTAILAVLWLKERLNPSRIFGVLIGFLGILVILRPGIAVIHPAAFAVIASAIGLSVAYVITKSVVHEDSAWTILFWMNLIQLPLSLGLSLQNWVWPSEALIPWVLGIGVAGFGLHLAISQAMTHADASVVVPFDFLRLPLITVVAWFMYQESLDMFVFIGAGVIVFGNAIILRGETPKKTL